MSRSGPLQAEDGLGCRTIQSRPCHDPEAFPAARTTRCWASSYMDRKDLP